MYILFDIGGTKMRVARADSIDHFNEPVILDTPKKYEEGIALLKKTILSLTKGDSIQKIVGGIAGPFSQKSGTMVSSPNLRDWANKPMKQELAHFFHTTVFMDNDAAMCGLGEAVFGAGKGFSIVAYITVSTGVGGARIVNGSIDERSIGFEPGKQIMDEQGLILEDIISGRAVEERLGKKPQEINDPAFWNSMAKSLAFGLNNIIVDWSPDVVVLGGSMMKTVGIPVDAVESYLKETLKVFPEIPQIKKSTLGDLGGLYGGLAYLKKE
jgi:glucokinase